MLHKSFYALILIISFSSRDSSVMTSWEFKYPAETVNQIQTSHSTPVFNQTLPSSFTSTLTSTPFAFKEDTPIVNRYNSMSTSTTSLHIDEDDEDSLFSQALARISAKKPIPMVSSYFLDENDQTHSYYNL
jgi:hypothetical protein